MRFFRTLSFVVCLSFQPVLRAETQVLNLRNQVPSSQPGQVESPKVRIGLKMVPYHAADAANPQDLKLDPSKAIKHMLRCEMDEPSHFYVGAFHIVVTPMAWDKNASRLAAKVDFMHRFGNEGDVEENFGSVEITGHLEGTKDLFVLRGYNQKVLKDKFQRPRVFVAVGAGQASPPLSKGEPAKQAVAPQM